MIAKNIFTRLPGAGPEEFLQQLARGSGFTLERIISHGHATPAGEWLEQEQDEWVILLSGRAGLLFQDGNEELVMEPGDYLLIPAHKRHRVEWTEANQDSVWLALHHV